MPPPQTETITQLMLTSSSFITRSHKRSQRDGLKMSKLDRVRFRPLAPNGLEATMNSASEANRFLPWKVPSVPDVWATAGGISGEAWPEQENSSSTWKLLGKANAKGLKRLKSLQHYACNCANVEWAPTMLEPPRWSPCSADEMEWGRHRSTNPAGKHFLTQKARRQKPDTFKLSMHLECSVWSTVHG